MHSLALVSSFNERYPATATTGPAKSDSNALPLGAVWANPSQGRRSSNDAASARPPAAAATSAAVDGCPSNLPPPPPGPPVMVLFPATLSLATFFAPPSAVALASGALSLLALLASWVWGWGLVSSAGVASGVAAGVATGLGVRLRPLGGWGGVTLSVLGVALLGGGVSSLALGIALVLSTLWRHGWWLYLHPECAPVVFMLCGTTADVAVGFLLSSVVQVHRTQPPKQPSEPKTPAPDGAKLRAQDDGTQSWNAVTPPGLSARAGGRRL